MPVYTNGIDVLALMRKILDKLVEKNIISRDELCQMLYDCTNPATRDVTYDRGNPYNSDRVTYET